MSFRIDAAPAGLVLAGGAGRRMGGVDKALLTWDGRPLIATVLDRFAPQVDLLAISANGDPSRFSRWDLPVLADAAPSKGPLSGVLAGLIWAADQGCGALVTVSVDAPRLPQDLVPRLLLAQESTGGPVIARTARGLHPTFALWPVGLAPALAAFLASPSSPRLRDFAEAHGAAMADFADEAEFANLNRPEDLSPDAL